jgi:hypothetical protein
MAKPRKRTWQRTENREQRIWRPVKDLTFGPPIKNVNDNLVEISSPTLKVSF